MERDAGEGTHGGKWGDERSAPSIAAPQRLSKAAAERGKWGDDEGPPPPHLPWPGLGEEQDDGIC